MFYFMINSKGAGRSIYAPLERKGWTLMGTLVKGELFTPKEFGKFTHHTMVPDEWYDGVEVKKTDTYCLFGARFMADGAPMRYLTDYAGDAERNGIAVPERKVLI